ncbi:hypothetical protein HYFRA_00004139 [Hymenoscyphus fraxineus]|uniref:Uncharacterized protein n=1 Tax=Hymenoscyphus fraxineus TaxID=746836 RepID=A0A9N9KPM5_9HELO|nr:hypothetical protein HYFRA_00004139 [Hymenoscyphus fraxineus]
MRGRGRPGLWRWRRRQKQRQASVSSGGYYRSLWTGHFNEEDQDQDQQQDPDQQQDQDKLLYQKNPERTQKIPGMAPIPLRSRFEAIQYTSQILGVSHSKGSGQPLATWAATVARKAPDEANLKPFPMQMFVCIRRFRSLQYLII